MFFSTSGYYFFLHICTSVFLRFFSLIHLGLCYCCFFHCIAVSLDDYTSTFCCLFLSTFPSQFIPLHIFNHSYVTPTTSHQARMELRRLKQEVRNKHAVTVIWAYWQGTKVFPPSCSVLQSQLSCHCLVSHLIL